MKGGFNNPPNHGDLGAGGDAGLASMKGGFNNPPNVPWNTMTSADPDTLQ